MRYMQQSYFKILREKKDILLRSSKATQILDLNFTNF